jgi:hypothetical protein
MKKLLLNVTHPAVLNIYASLQKISFKYYKRDFNLVTIPYRSM